MLRSSCVRLFAGVLSASFVLWLAGCGGSAALGPITITAASSTVDGTDTTTLTAAVTNDKNAAGVTWTASAGTLSNTTTTSATFTAPAATSSPQSITITATSVADSTKTGTLTITIPAAPAIPSLTVAQGTVSVGTAYSLALTATGGVAPYKWALASGSAPLPPCLSLSSSGTLSSPSVPTAACAGVYSGIKFTVTDSGTPNALTATSTAQTITVVGPIIALNATLPAGVVGAAYAGGVTATGALGTTTYSLSGAFPTSGHLTFNTSTGAITGTPYANDVGPYNFTVTVVDQYGDTLTSGPLTLTINNAPTITFGAAPAATGTFNSAYSSAVTASGGAGALTYQLVAGSTLPPDLTLASSGALSGTLSKAADVGTFSFSVKASDSYGDSATSPTYPIVVTYPPLTVTSLVPATGYVGSAYPNTTLAATGGNGGSYTWTWAAASGSSLPPGLSLSSAGVISGTPAAGSAGTYSVVVTATDSATPANSGQATLTFTIKPGITINSITLPEGYAGSSYPPTGGNSTVTATGGTGTYTWSIAGASGSSVPSGLSINPTSGLISGTLAANSAGSYSVVVTATDNATPANTAGMTLPLTIGPAVSIAVTNPQPNAYPGAAYTSNTFTGSGGNGGPYNWTLTAASGSSVPSGFTIGTGPSATTTITAASPSNTGTTTAAYNVVVTAKDSLGNQYSTNAAINVEATLNVSSPATLPGVSVGVNPNYQLTAAGGSGTYTNGWTVTSGAASLAAVGLSVTSNGVLTGTNPTAGTANFAVTVTDSEGHVSAPANLSVTVTSALTITTTTLPSGNAGKSYSQTLAAAGGSGTYTNWQITSGASQLTALNLSLGASSGTISGTPSAAGTASFTVQVTDSAGTKATQNLTIQIYPALSLPAPDPGSLPSTGYAGYPYNGGGTGVIMGSGGSGNLTISVASGLPTDGLSAVANGSQLSISGTPATTPTPPYTITFSVTLTDNATGNSITQSGYTINVVAATSVSLPAPNPSSLGSATQNQSYNGAINASGGVPGYTWSINGTPVGSTGYSLGNGTLAAYSTGGNTLSITGTPSSTGTVTLTNVNVVDAAGTSATNTYTITVNAAQPLSITINDVPQGMVNMPYTFNNLNISGGTPPYTVTYSNLPANLAQGTGSNNLFGIVGTPTASGQTTVTVKVTDSATSPNSQTTTFTLPVVPQTTGNNNGKLKGQYACYVQQTWDTGVTGGNGSSTLYRGGAVFAFTADGNGNITGGELDSNSPTKGYTSAATNGALSGSYAVGSDDRGYALLSAANQSGSLVLAIAGGKLDGTGFFSELALISMDDVGATPSGKWSSGHCYEQSASGVSGFSPGGGYVWALRGESMEGNLESMIGFSSFGSGSISGLADGVNNGVYFGDQTITGSYSGTTDAYGRMTISLGPTGAANPMVIYLTNNPVKETLIMSINSHNASSNADFQIGEARAQNPGHVTASDPLSGPMVMYSSGPDTSLTSFASVVAQLTGSSSAAQITPNVWIENDAGTVKARSMGSTSYTTDSTTGRTTFGSPGDVMYIYDTGSAAVLLGDTGESGSTAQDLLGWLEPQTPPTSGAWSDANIAASYFLHKVDDYYTNLSPNNASFTIGSNGSFTSYAEDEGGQDWASWSNGLCGPFSCTGITGGVFPDTTANSTTGALGLDPNGAFGVFNAQATQNGATQTMAYCIAVSVDTATNSNTYGRVVCLDNSSSHSSLSIGQQ